MFVPLWKRIIAYLFDNILISIIIVSPLMITDMEESFAGFVNLLMNTDFWLASLFIVILTLFYWSFLEWMFGQSIGKILMKLKVESINGKELSASQAIIRNFSKVSSIILFFDVLYMLLSKGNQRFFEKLSHTIVVEGGDYE